MTERALIPSQPLRGMKHCIACGSTSMRRGRRYCSPECRDQMLWVLSLSKGLLIAFNARYAAFSFDQHFVVLDILPIWSQDISRFLYRRPGNKKPAEDLKHLVLQSGSEWYHLVGNRTSKSLASLVLLKRNHRRELNVKSIRPDKKLKPRLSRFERECLKLLELPTEELFSESNVAKIRSAYKRLAKVYHPDLGGDAEKFKKLNAAHQQMLLWAENPHFTLRKALLDCWSYDGATNKWSPPL
ncbi:MAG: DnaJ domain-containing protein [Desulfobacterota bacterium]|nr:DnaJ domain-containing protein [Thermodesulfobacteriota bacterium]